MTLALGDGTQKRYPNEAAFVLIGADPPVAWLEKMGVRFVERPHQYQLGKTDEIVRRFVRARSSVPRMPRAPPRRSSAAAVGTRRVPPRCTTHVGRAATDADGRAGERSAQVAALGDEHLLDEAIIAPAVIRIAAPLPHQAALRHPARRSSTRRFRCPSSPSAASRRVTPTPDTAVAIS